MLVLFGFVLFLEFLFELELVAKSIILELNCCPFDFGLDQILFLLLFFKLQKPKLTL
jgi:hypothetical protein